MKANIPWRIREGLHQLYESKNKQIRKPLLNNLYVLIPQYQNSKYAADSPNIPKNTKAQLYQYLIMNPMRKMNCTLN